MRNAVRLLVVMFCLSVISAWCPGAKADECDKKTILTFSGPVVVAGHRLEAGTYVFKLADTVDRHVVQIFNQDENHVYATIIAIPDYRVEPADNTVIKFAETADGSSYAGDLPGAGVPIKEWFYPGDNFGQEFKVKPAPEEVAIAEPTTPPAPPAAEAPAPEPAPAEVTPTPAPEEPAPQAEQPAPLEQPQTEQAAPAPEPAPEPPKQLPKTASSMPLVGLIGILSLGAAASLRVISKRLS
jgi:hypothetical protein